MLHERTAAETIGVWVDPAEIDGFEIDGIDADEEPTETLHGEDVAYYSVFVHQRGGGRWCVGDFSRLCDALAYSTDLARLYTLDGDPDVPDS